MRSTTSIIFAAAVVAALAGPAAADTSIATDPERMEIVEPPPPPPPPEPERPLPRESLVVTGSALTARMPEGAGQLRDLGRGGALTISYLQRKCSCPTGVAVRGMFLGGHDSRLYSLDVQLIASAKLGRRTAAPFVGIGLAFGTVRFADTKQLTSGMALGPAATLGLHGFLTDSLYWRGEVTALGAGGAVIAGGASVGWVFGS